MAGRIRNYYRAHPVRRTVLTALIVSLILLITWTLWANKALECNEYTVTSSKLPQAFDGFRIAQVSDLHNDEFGDHNEELLQMLRDAKPDMIAITGDMSDAYDRNPDIALAFAAEAVQIAPCYYVTGNHESRYEDIDQFLRSLEKCGVNVLYDAYAVIENNGDKIAVLGINDPTFHSYDRMDVAIPALMVDADYYVLLSHRPERMDDYAAVGVDLALCGHAHGGQVRLPFVGGLIAPNQGWFPEYDTGAYTQHDTTMIVSRGLGNSSVPIRFNNRPEVVVVQLKKE